MKYRSFASLVLVVCMISTPLSLFAQASGGVILDDRSRINLVPSVTQQNVASLRLDQPVKSNMTPQEAGEMMTALGNDVDKTGSYISYAKYKFLEHKYGQTPGVSQKPNNRYSNYGGRYLNPTNQTLYDVVTGGSGGFDSPFLTSGNQRSELDLMTGARAVNESLQVSSIATRDRGNEIPTIPLSSVERLDIQSHPWSTMIAERPMPEVSPIFKLVPVDDFVLYAKELRSIGSMEAAFRELSHFGDAYFGLGTAVKARELVLRRLGVTDISSIENKVSEVAFVSEDLSFMTGTNYAFIMKPKSGGPENLETSFAGERLTKGVIGDYYVVATSPQLYEAMNATQRNSAISMFDAKDFTYALQVLDQKRDGIVYFSEKFILKMVSPEYRTGADRRNLALLRMDTLQYSVFAYRSLMGEWPRDFKAISSAGFIDLAQMNTLTEGYSIDTDGRVRSREWGTLYDIAPLAKNPVTMLSDAEVVRYKSFKEGYQSYWREFFDPVGVAFRVDDQLYFHTIILPLIDESQYSFLKNIFGGDARKFDALQKPVMTSPILFLAKLNIDDYLLSDDSLIKSLGTARAKARQAVVISNLSNVQLGLELYFDAHQSYGYSSSCTTGTFAELTPTYLPTSVADMFKDAVVNCSATGANYSLSVTIPNTSLLYCVSDSAGRSYHKIVGGRASCLSPAINMSEANRIIEEAIKNEENKKTPEIRKAEINKTINDGLKSMGASKEINIFDLFGSELQFGVGDSVPFAISNIADYDGYVGIKLKDTARFKDIVNTVYSAFVKEFSRGGGFGMFALSSKEPIKNTYNGVEYQMIPTGFVNLYLLYVNDYVNFFISQSGVNRMIDGEKGTSTPSLTPIQSRVLADIGDTGHMMLLADLTPYQEYKKGLLSSDGSWSSYVFSRTMRDLRGYIADYQLGRKMSQEEYFPGIPTRIRGLDLVIDNNSISLGQSRVPFDTVSFENDSSNYRSIYSYDDVRDTAKKPLNEIYTDKEKADMLSEFNKLEGFGINLRFTKEGLDTKVSIRNPLVPFSVDGNGVFSVGNLKKTLSPGFMLSLGFGMIVIIGLGGLVLYVRRIKSIRTQSAQALTYSPSEVSSAPIAPENTSVSQVVPSTENEPSLEEIFAQSLSTPTTTTPEQTKSSID